MPFAPSPVAATINGCPSVTTGSCGANGGASGGGPSFEKVTGTNVYGVVKSGLPLITARTRRFRRPFGHRADGSSNVNGDS